MVTQPIIARDIRSIFIEEWVPLTCTALSLRSNCRLPILHCRNIDGQVVAWLGGPDRPGTSGLAVAVKGGVVIQVSAVHVSNFRAVVLGGMQDVLQNY
jgi:hypothetical protein